MTNKHPVKRIDSELGWYEYRGIQVERNDDVPAGYWGRYTVKGIEKGGYMTDTLRDCKNQIDAYIERVEEE